MTAHVFATSSLLMWHGHYDPFEYFDESRWNILFISDNCNNDEEDPHELGRQPLQILSKKSCSWTASEFHAMLETARILPRNQPNSRWKTEVHPASLTMESGARQMEKGTTYFTILPLLFYTSCQSRHSAERICLDFCQSAQIRCGSAYLLKGIAQRYPTDFVF